ncbi:respiratory nitrate reductase subunit gamma [Spongiactinospora sp. TRM90649]|uniref:respiratory nitrate reductase subunit gamma n=1 Tax=Spongiactinospora sp. TRM90649 TaxID=3031114 RepID=UPI0023F9D8FA|nr:respiratory nitrate reductase subunit gamma [Spongiactinospora sp. TRM90649]MDF5751362.1 respiratory nitrate reductase subunit gamma [Spongiactinospora sp. TRM90649]
MTPSAIDIFLWGALPYLCVALLISGLIWRWRYDKFGWTTRSSELYESQLLRYASPMFHVGLLVVLLGHLLGLFIPQSWTAAVGITEGIYHSMALWLGLAAGVLTYTGIVLLIWRRRTNGPVFLATTRNDKVMYIFLVAALTLGLATTLINAARLDYNYRVDVSPWVRSLFIFQPEVSLMAGTPIEYRIHSVSGLLLFAILPFTRLVHAFAAPVHYLFRPYIVYRARDPQNVSTAAVRPGWGQGDI